MKKKEETDNASKKGNISKKEKVPNYLCPVFICVIIAVMVAVIPIFFYCCYFNEFKISEDPSKWGVFGDFIGGTTNSILSFFALILSSVAVYISFRMSYDIQKRNEVQIQLQCKPVPFISLTNFPDRISVEIQNMGVGSMLITKVALKKGENTYLHFRDLLDKENKSSDVPFLEIRINTSPDFALAPSHSISVFEMVIKPYSKDDLSNIKTEMNTIKNIIGQCTLSIDYKDVFENPNQYKKELFFLRPKTVE